MRYFVALFIALGLVFLLIFVLFHDGSKSKLGPTHKALISYASTDADVRLTIDGPVNADQDHQQARVTVNRDNVTFERISGYNGNVVDTQIFNNSENAYAVFLAALSHAGFTLGSNDPSLSDERGFCARGDRYVFELRQDDKDIERYWASSCGNPKTYLGSVVLSLQLFKAQVPGYTNLTQNLQL